MAINFFVIPLRLVLFINVSFSCYYNFLSYFYDSIYRRKWSRICKLFSRIWQRNVTSWQSFVKLRHTMILWESDITKLFFFFYHEFNSFARITRLKRGDSILRGSRVFIINFLRTIRLKLNSIEGRTRLEVSFGKAIQFFPFKIQFTITRPRL